MLGCVLYSQGPGGGQGWRDTQCETVLRLVANQITPESLFRPLVITPPPPPPPPASLSQSPPHPALHFTSATVRSCQASVRHVETA